MEIERKFLIRSPGALSEIHQHCFKKDIWQGYLVTGDVEVRIRRVLDKDGERFFQTVKVGSGLVRREVEFEIGWREGTKLYELCYSEVVKSRYVYDSLDIYGRWDIDAYVGGLITAEIELERPDQTYIFPHWLVPFVEREITGNPEYANQNLAVPRRP